jgi:hypothetical protein
VQLGFRSLPPADARAQLAPTIAIGFSAHAGDELALWQASDYLLLGPVFDTPSKRATIEPLGLEGLAREIAARRATGVGHRRHHVPRARRPCSTPARAGSPCARRSSAPATANLPCAASRAWADPQPP